MSYCCLLSKLSRPGFNFLGGGLSQTSQMGGPWVRPNLLNGDMGGGGGGGGVRLKISRSVSTEP